MNVNFFANNCITQSSQKRFGLCDDPPPAENVAYIDEQNGVDWIAVVDNERRIEVSFVGIDHCPEMLRPLCCQSDIIANICNLFSSLLIQQK